MWQSEFGYSLVKNHKSVRLDDYTVMVIESYKGRSFSDKLRRYVYDVEMGRYCPGKK